MIGSPLGTWTSKSVIWNSTTSHYIGDLLMAPHRNGNNGVTFQMRQRRNFRILTGFNFLEGNKVMNSRKFVLLGCVVACVFAASTATAQMRGHGGSMPRMGMRGPPMSHSMGMRGGFMPHSMGRMPMQRGPMMNSPSGFRRFGNRDFNRNDRFGRFNRFNDGRFVRYHRFHHFNHFNHFQ